MPTNYSSSLCECISIKQPCNSKQSMASQGKGYAWLLDYMICLATGLHDMLGYWTTRAYLPCSGRYHGHERDYIPQRAQYKYNCVSDHSQKEPSSKGAG